MSRPSWDTYFLGLAYHAATRATCDRKHVGAVLVAPDRRVVATGYNGSPAGVPSCDDVGHEMHDNHCIRTLHAESNAIDYAGREARGTTLYVTVIPCYDCAKRIVNAGIVKVFYDEFYGSRYGKSDQVVQFFAAANVECVQLDTPGLTLIKTKLSEVEKIEAAVMSTIVVEYACGCTGKGIHAGPRCLRHDQPIVHG